MVAHGEFSHADAVPAGSGTTLSAVVLMVMLTNVTEVGVESNADIMPRYRQSPIPEYGDIIAHGDQSASS